jgi:hypothetical protein
MSHTGWKDTLTKDASVEEVSNLLKLVFQHMIKNATKLLLIPLIIGLLAFLIGLLMYEKKQKATYIIAAEEETASGFEGLMAQFGLDVGGSNPGGVFKGENLVELFKTRSMIERTLLNPVPDSDPPQLFADVFFQDTKHARKSIFKGVDFKQDRSLQDRRTDSALYLTYEYVRDEVLSVSKPEKKIGFIFVNVIHKQTDIAIAYSHVTIRTVTDFYIESLTRKARLNLDILRYEADSVREILNENLMITARESDLNVNPLWQMMRVEHSKAMIDLQISISLFGELIKNLKLAEISLRRQTPLIEVIEEPRYPLTEVGFRPWQWGVMGLLAGLLLALYLSFRHFNRDMEMRFERESKA